MTEHDVDVVVDQSLYNDRLKSVLKRKLRSYLTWKVYTEKELKNRRSFLLKYLRHHYLIVQMYINWLKPYLKNVRRLAYDEKRIDSPDLVGAFEGTKAGVFLAAMKRRNWPMIVGTGGPAFATAWTLAGAGYETWITDPAKQQDCAMKSDYEFAACLDAYLREKFPNRYALVYNDIKDILFPPKKRKPEDDDGGVIDIPAEAAHNADLNAKKKLYALKPQEKEPMKPVSYVDNEGRITDEGVIKVIKNVVERRNNYIREKNAERDRFMVLQNTILPYDIFSDVYMQKLAETKDDNLFRKKLIGDSASDRAAYLASKFMVTFPKAREYVVNFLDATDDEAKKKAFEDVYRINCEMALRLKAIIEYRQEFLNTGERLLIAMMITDDTCNIAPDAFDNTPMRRRRGRLPGGTGTGTWEEEFNRDIPGNDGIIPRTPAAPRPSRGQNGNGGIIFP